MRQPGFTMIKFDRQLVNLSGVFRPNTWHVRACCDKTNKCGKGGTDKRLKGDLIIEWVDGRANWLND